MSKGDSIRVLVGDSTRMNSQLIGEALQRSRSPRFEIAFPSGFSSAETAQEIIRAAPDVAIIGAALRDGPFAGYSVLRALQSKKVSTRSVLLLEDCERDLVVDAFRAGARAVFSRTEPWIRLPRCINSVYKGQIWASSRELEYVFEELAAARPLHVVDVQGRNLLSKREQQVVALVAEGFTNRQISQELKLSEHTVKNYLFRVFEKLGVSTRVELVLYALSQNPPNQLAAPEPPVSVVELSRRSRAQDEFPSERHPAR
jgi:two-component system nitrate/nitrite response regulator NarL